MLSVNTNLASLNAQRNLSGSQEHLNLAIQRLSSGLRINSAKDDAAGLAISERMSSQIRGLNQAARNANDGISLAQTGEGALAEINNNIQRIRELAVQAANSTNSSSDRAALQAEVTQRVSEITRIGNQTEFNGLKLLNGTFTNQDFQVGASANQTIRITSMGDARATALGNNTMTADGTITGNVVTASATANGVTALTAAGTSTIATTDAGGSTLTSSYITYSANAGANVIAGAINSAGSSVSATATGSNSATLSGLSVAGTVTFTLNTQTTTGDGTFTAVSANISATVTDKNDLSSLVSAINGATSTTGITADFTTAGNKSSITLSTLDGRNIGIGTYANSGGATESIVFSGSTLTEGGTVSAVKTGTIDISSTRGQITMANASTEVFTTASQVSSFSSLAAVDISSQTNAQSALAVVDAALGKISSSRADLGAYQNRFSSAIASLQTSAENITAAKSRILDADYATETANLTKSSITQQAGVAMLAQANALPQQILSLLRG